MIWLFLACQQDAFDWKSEFLSNPERGLEKLQEKESLERLSIVDSLSKEFPGKTTELCSVLPTPSQEHCLEQNKRPHLWSKSKGTDSSHERSSVSVVSVWLASLRRAR